MKLTIKGRYSMGNLVKNQIIRCFVPCPVHCFVPDSLDSFVPRFVMGGRA